MHSLSLYVVATCFRKIFHRFNHPTFSSPYLRSLKNLDVTAYTFRASSVQAKPRMTENDELLLSSLLAELGTKLIPGFPILREVAQSTQLDQEQPVAFYSEATYREFHKLLYTLLDSFGTSLKALSAARGKGKMPAKGSAEFKACLRHVMFYGNALQRIAMGSAIDPYLQNIEPLLADHRRHGLNDPEDPDLSQVGTTVGEAREPLWMSYKKWLALILVHFNAVETLVAYVTGPYFSGRSISIKILVSPPVSHSIFDWETLLSNPALFPVQAVDLNKTNVATNEELLDFLKEATAAAHPAREVVMRIQGLVNGKHPNWKKAAELTALLAAYKLPNFYDYSNRIGHEMARGTPDFDSRENICRDLELMKARASLFIDLDQSIFTGTVHCEVSLASLFHISQDSGDEHRALSQHFNVS